MKKLLMTAAAFLLLCACGGSGDKAALHYRGLSMALPVAQFADSLTARGFALDSAASDSGRTLVFTAPRSAFRLLVAFTGDTVRVIQENYKASSNDSTRQLWQQLRDDFERELGSWPNCPMLKEDHRIANFETEGGFIAVTLENTYSPNLNVRYTAK